MTDISKMIRETAVYKAMTSGPLYMHDHEGITRVTDNLDEQVFEPLQRVVDDGGYHTLDEIESTEAFKTLIRNIATVCQDTNARSTLWLYLYEAGLEESMMMLVVENRAFRPKYVRDVTPPAIETFLKLVV